MRLALDRDMIDRWLNGVLRMARDAPWRRGTDDSGGGENRYPSTFRSVFAQGPFVAGGAGIQAQPRVARSPFTPTRPIQSADALIGRQPQLDRAMTALEVEGAHLAIYGERGYGKTSLANVIAALAEARGFGVVRHSCSADSSFSDVMGAVLDKVPSRFLRRSPAHQEQAPAPAAGPPVDWTVADVTGALERVRAGHLLVFIDEYDRLRNEQARRNLTELLKNTSDLGLRVSFVLIGVAETLDELLALHQSVQRCLVSLPLPLLSDASLKELIERGCKRLGLRLEPDALALLLRLSHQSPYFAQLLSLHATQRVPEGEVVVTPAMVAAAGRRVLDETWPVFQPVLRHVPDKRVTGAAISLPDLLFAAATGACDRFGWFKAADLALHRVATPEAQIDEAQIDEALAMLTREDAGPVLRMRQASGSREYVFARANLRNHVLLRDAHHRGLI